MIILEIISIVSELSDWFENITLLSNFASKYNFYSF